MQFDNCIGIFFGDFFNLDATLRRQHQQVLLGGTVECERRVVLLFDVARVFNPHALDDMALNVHAQNVVGVEAGFFSVVRQLDAASFAASTNLNLCLHDDGVTRSVSDFYCFINSVGSATRAHRDVETGEVLLALVFEQVH